MSDNDIVLLPRDSDPVTIPRSWVDRWDALYNVVEDMGATRIEWPLNTAVELQPWLELNRRMDDSVDETLDLLPYSSVRGVVDVMIPFSDSWLLHVYIEEDNRDRSDLYSRIGRYIRENQISYPYTIGTGTGPGLHHDCLLHADPAYGIHYQGDLIDTELYPEEMLEAIIDSPLNLITGIVHTG